MIIILINAASAKTGRAPRINRSSVPDTANMPHGELPPHLLGRLHDSGRDCGHDRGQAKDQSNRDIRPGRTVKVRPHKPDRSVPRSRHRRARTDTHTPGRHRDRRTGAGRRRFPFRQSSPRVLGRQREEAYVERRILCLTRRAGSRYNKELINT